MDKLNNFMSFSRSNLVTPKKHSRTPSETALNLSVKNLEMIPTDNKIESKKRIILNISGVKFDVLLRIFERYPNTRLGRLKTIIDENSDKLKDQLSEICDDFDIIKDEFYFNCDPDVFKLILNYYKHGQLHFDDKMCAGLFQKEINFWDLNECLIDDCCQNKYTVQKEAIENELEIKKEVLHALYHQENYGKILPKIRKKAWYILDKPMESYIGKVIIFLSFDKKK